MIDSPKFRLAIACLLLTIFASALQAQEPKKPLRVNLSEDGSTYLNFSISFQFWLRSAQLNPGSIVGVSQQPDAITDVSIRRIRAGVSGMVSKKVFANFNTGVTNLNYLSDRSVAMDVLDAYAEYRHRDFVHIGIGKTAWGGMSRYTAASSTRTLGGDISILPLPTLNLTDALLRRLAIFFKGQIDRFDYRIAVFKPLAIEQGGPDQGDLIENIAQFTDLSYNTNWGITSYFKWFFREKESNGSAFSPGTYLNERFVMNVGVGYEFQQERTASLQNGETVFHPLYLASVDFFLNLPVSKKHAWTFYTAYFFYDFGPNFIRNIGVNNPVIRYDETSASFNGAGVAFPIIGTGQSFYTSTGYYFSYKENKGFLPYFDIQVSDYERLNDPMISWNAGLSWLLNEHKSKFSAYYQSRPIYDDNGTSIDQSDRLGQVVVQYQLVLN